MATADLEPTVDAQQTSAATSPDRLRAGAPEDAQACSEICFSARSRQSSAFPSDFPAVDVALGLISMPLSRPGFYSGVAEVDSQPVGSNFLDLRGPIAAVVPITVTPEPEPRYWPSSSRGPRGASRSSCSRDRLRRPTVARRGASP